MFGEDQSSNSGVTLVETTKACIFLPLRIKMCLQNSGITGQKFTKMLSDVDMSSAVLTHATLSETTLVMMIIIIIIASSVFA